MGLGDDREPALKTPDRAQLVGRQPGEVVLDPLGQRAGETAERPAASRRGSISAHDLVERRRALGVRACEYLEDRLDVALRGPLVVRLGEPLGRDQLVLQLGGVAVRERIPVRRARPASRA